MYVENNLRRQTCREDALGADNRQLQNKTAAEQGHGHRRQHGGLLQIISLLIATNNDDNDRRRAPRVNVANLGDGNVVFFAIFFNSS